MATDVHETEVIPLVSELVSSGITALWQDDRLGREIEDSLMCGTTSLVAVACATSSWMRDSARVTDPFDRELRSRLAGPLKDLRPLYVKLKEGRRSGEFPPGWGKLTDNFSALHYGDHLYRKFKVRDPNWLDYVSWHILEDLSDLYRRWRL